MEKEAFNLSQLGYHENFILTPEGNIINSETGQPQQPDNHHTVSIKTADGKWIKKAIKTLYREAYKTEFCIDNIQNLPDEQWKEIPNTSWKYFISTYARVKSYCGYEARLRKPEDNGKGYLRVDIGGKYRLIHLLMAETFLPPAEDCKTEIHHRDLNPYNNKLSNLERLTPAQHRKVHRELNSNKKVQ